MLQEFFHFKKFFLNPNLYYTLQISLTSNGKQFFNQNNCTLYFSIEGFSGNDLLNGSLLSYDPSTQIFQNPILGFDSDNVHRLFFINCSFDHQNGDVLLINQNEPFKFKKDSDESSLNTLSEVDQNLNYTIIPIYYNQDQYLSSESQNNNFNAYPFPIRHIYINVGIPDMGIDNLSKEKLKNNLSKEKLNNYLSISLTSKSKYNVPVIKNLYIDYDNQNDNINSMGYDSLENQDGTLYDIHNNEYYYIYPYPVPQSQCAEVLFKQGTSEQFKKIKNFAKNTFYIDQESGRMKIGDIVNLHSIITLTQQQYDDLSSQNLINSNIIYIIVSEESLSDIPTYIRYPEEIQSPPP